MTNPQLDLASQEIGGPGTKVAEAPEREVSVPASNKPVDLGSILELAKSGVDPETVGKMVDLYERVHAIQAEQAFNESMAVLQEYMDAHPIPSRGRNKVTKAGATVPYPYLEDIQRGLRLPCRANGFSYTFDTETSGKAFVVVTRVHHVMGLTRETRTTLPLDESGSKNQVQGVGSTESYGMRYGLLKAFGLTRYLHDDDGGGGPGEAPATISDEQEATLKEWQSKLTDSRRKRFSDDYMGSRGWTSLSEIPASEYDTVLADIRRVAG